jgi:hypothetical protein
MKVDNLEKQLLPIELLAHDSLSRVKARVKEVFTRARVDGEEEGKLSYWQFVFSQSKTNGCCYRGEDLPHLKWRWPRDTWFQQHLSDHVKAIECATPQARTEGGARLAPLL